MKNNAFGIGLILSLACIADPALAQVPETVVLSGRTVLVGTTPVEAGCEVARAILMGDELVVACADGRIPSFHRTATGFAPGEVRQAAGPVGMLFVVEGRVWCIIDGVGSEVGALPLAPPPPPPAPPPAPAPPPLASPTAPTASPPEGEFGERASPRRGEPSRDRRAEFEVPPEPIEGVVVSAVRGNVIELSGCSGLGLELRARVVLGRSRAATESRTAPIGEVTECTPSRALVQVGFGERVVVGDDVARTNARLTRVLTDPPEVRSTVTVGGAVRAWIDAAGIGTLDELSLTWRADIPFALRVRVFPFAALYVGPTNDVPRETGTVVGGATVDAFFDHRYFAIGVGVGFGQYTTRFARTLLEPSSDQRTGFTLAPSIRIGPVDGLHLAVTTHVLAVADEFRWGGIDAAFQIPLLPGFSLVPRGGYAPSGLGFAEAGLRIAVSGNGEPGTVFLTPIVGWAGVDTGIHGFRSGPMVGLGLEVRAGS